MIGRYEILWDDMAKTLLALSTVRMPTTCN